MCVAEKAGCRGEVEERMEAGVEWGITVSRECTCVRGVADLESARLKHVVEMPLTSRYRSSAYNGVSCEEKREETGVSACRCRIPLREVGATGRARQSTVGAHLLMRRLEYATSVCSLKANGLRRRGDCGYRQFPLATGGLCFDCFFSI